nr:MAG TPA: hypothetical protein [Caudoviricetes sp.]
MQESHPNPIDTNISFDDLTKDQQKFLVTLYKEYLARKSSQSNSKARTFPNVKYIQENYFEKSDIDDLFFICCALHKAQFIKCSFYDNTACNIIITDKTISYMENRITNGLKGVLNFLTKFYP